MSVYLTTTMRLLFSEIYKRDLYRTRIVAHSKHVAYYGSKAAFPYYILTQSPPNRESSPIRHAEWRRAKQDKNKNVTHNSD